MRVTDQYVYVDAHYQDPTTGKLLKWFRVRWVDVKKRVIDPSEAMNCYASVQRYRDAVSLRDLAAMDPAKGNIKVPGPNGHDVEEAERQRREQEPYELHESQLHYCGPYFDFDADPSKLGVSADEALIMAQKDALTLAQWFIREFDLNPAHVQCFYSGMKGFHVMVRPEPFAMHPHKNLTAIIQRMALQLNENLKLPTMDMSVYTVSRMWRLVNTQHPKSKRYKVELTVDELGSMEPSQIRKLGNSPRIEVDIDEDTMREGGPPSMVWEPVEYRDIRPENSGREWWNELVDHYDAYRAMVKMRPKLPLMIPENSDEYPDCIKDMLENGPKDGGPTRNRVILPIAGFFRDAGIDEYTAYQKLEDWTLQFYPDPGKRRERVQNAKSVVQTAYRGNLRFACRMIRANRGAGKAGLVKCCGEANCDWIRDPQDQEPVEIPLVHLAEATNGCYIDGKIKSPIHVSAIAGAPYGVPIKGKILCVPDADKEMCTYCPNLEAGGKLEWSLSADSRSILNLIGVTDFQRKGAIRQHCGITHNCKSNRVLPEERSNVQEIEIIPMVDFERLYHQDDEKVNEVGGKGSKHVQRRAFYLGHGMEANKKYLMESSVFEHPKDQRLCFLFDKTVPAEDDIDKFEMTETLLENLQIFKPQTGQSISDKLNEIHADFEANVHQIGGRRDLSIAIDLAYHSVIGFTLLGMPVTKGWFELLVMGDSATAKSTLTQRMMQHFGLGEMIAGEEARRTGLVHNTVQFHKQWILKWGKIPQNDRRLLVIDEFAGIDSEEVAKLTQLRSEGKARGSGVTADHETWARTRLILLTNPKSNSTELAAYNYGIDSIRQLFKELQDIRRVDLAIIVGRGEVSTEMLNYRWDLLNKPHYYTSDICQKLVLWAWSREPKDIVWKNESEDRVRYWAQQLGDTYQCDIPLAERADLKIKIARIAAAVAARMFSTDDEARKLYVLPEHVDFAANFMDDAYRKPIMSYMEYARRWKAENQLTEARRNTIIEGIQSFEDTDTLVAALLDENLFPKSKLKDTLDMPQDEFDRLWKLLLKQRMLKSTARGYRKSPAFTNILKAMKSRKSGYADDGVDPFEADTNNPSPGWVDSTYSEDDEAPF